MKLATLLLWILFAFAMEARVTRIEITSRESLAGGIEFGAVGAYEKLRGTAFFEVDPSDPRNAVVFDLDKAPRNERGKVEFSADIYILKPVDQTRAKGTLFVEVPNRGNKSAHVFLMNDVLPGGSMNNPSTVADLGNGFLLEQGYTLAYVGWSSGVVPGGDRMIAQFPIAMESAQPVTGMAWTLFFDGDGAGGTPFTRPLMGSATAGLGLVPFRSYATISTDSAAANADLRVRRSDSASSGTPELPDGEVIPTSRWSFARCPNGPPGTPSAVDICLEGGFQKDLVYELTYMATGSPISGLGYVTTRDFVAFLRQGGPDSAGNPNPVSGISAAICLGISISGQYLRDFLYLGFNEDEQGRRVCDGAFIQGAGAHKAALNYRFARDPNATPFLGQHAGRNNPDLAFPMAYGVRQDPLTGRVDGILKRPATDPKVFHTDSSTEYWQRRSSLTDTDENGTVDLVQPSNVRKYVFAGMQHVAQKNAPPNYGTLNRKCDQLSNPTHPGILARALLVALEDWVRRGVEPPPGHAPSLRDGTLTTSDQANTGFPNIPGVAYNGAFNASGAADFGPRVIGNSGIIDFMRPRILNTYRILVPKVDSIGNDAGGIRHPFVEVPTATITGWSLRRAEFGEGDLCDASGSMIPLRKARTETAAAGDPRPSLEELYGDHLGYALRVARSALKLYDQRLMLWDDVYRLFTEAMNSNILVDQR